MDFMNFRILNGPERILIFEVNCLLFEISGQRFAKFAVDLNDAIRQLGKATSSDTTGMSALCQEETYAPQQDSRDHSMTCNAHASRMSASALMSSVRIQCVARIFVRYGLREPSGSLDSLACH